MYEEGWIFPRIEAIFFTPARQLKCRKRLSEENKGVSHFRFLHFDQNVIFGAEMLPLNVQINKSFRETRVKVSRKKSTKKVKLFLHFMQILITLSLSSCSRSPIRTDHPS